MKIFLAQQNYHIGNFNSNTAKIISAIEKAKANGGDLIVFSELCVCGYPPADFLFFYDFINCCDAAIEKIAGYAHGIAVIVGAPQKNGTLQGKNLYNAAWFLADGKVKQVVQKTCLPTYDVFDEDRYFEPASDWNVVAYQNKRIALTVCEDIWNLGADPLYTHCPMDFLSKQFPDLIINLSASPFDYTHEEDRKAILKANVLKYSLPVFYCNAVGSQTEIVFDGNSLVFDKQGNICGELPSFAEGLEGFLFHDDGTVTGNCFIPASHVPNEELAPEELDSKMNISHVHDALVLGIRDYFTKMGFQRAILGSSGGIDSAVTQALVSTALGAESVQAVLMPSAFSSIHSVEDAVQLSKNLGNPFVKIPINPVYEAFLSTLHPLFEGMPFNVTEENIQSRIRGNLLMAMANKFGNILVNTSNKSELATGYGTLYGDMAGGLGVLGDCYKLQVYELAKYINREKEFIPLTIINKAPSAELRPNQKDSDSLPDYGILDRILYQYIERSLGPEEIKEMGFDPSLVDRVLKMVNLNEYKRNQFCPIIRVSPKAFGKGRRMPVAGKYLS